MTNLILNIIGDFHPLLVHFPIGIFGLIAFNLILYKFNKIELNRPYFKIINGFCLATLVLSIAAGIASENVRSYSSKDLELLEWHKRLGFALLVLYSIGFYFLYYQEKKPYFFKAYVVLFTLSFLCMSIGGHLGSTIVHGEIKLIRMLKSKPQPIASEKKTVSTQEETEKSTSQISKQIDFKTQILPILEDNCIKCHGPDKQKGDLRLDTLEFASVITPFQPDKSELYRLINLPEGHEDVMPSKGDLLSPEAIKLIHDWILQGAKVADENNATK